MAFKSYYKLVKYKNLNKIPFYLENVGSDSATLSYNTLYSDATNVEYSTDMLTWSSTPPTVPVNGKVYIRANATTWCTNVSSVSARFRLGTAYNAGGNIMSLLYGSNFTGNETAFPDNTKTDIFYGFFQGYGYDNGALKSVEQLLLPATTLAYECYGKMFCSCTSLTTAPVLPATTLTNYCYSNMFRGCTALTAAPALNATTLTQGCYQLMFYECTSLTTAPTLPATTLVYSCYNAMFNGCTSLTNVTCLATSISASQCTNNWLNGVAANGTFTKAASMSSWTTGANGIPSGWTVQDA